MKITLGQLVDKLFKLQMAESHVERLMGELYHEQRCDYGDTAPIEKELEEANEWVKTLREEQI